MNIKQLNEVLDRILEEDTEVSIRGLKLIPHGEGAVKYYDKAVEYFKKHGDMVKCGFVNLSVADLKINDDDVTSLGFEFK